jgi:hypothetical protein
MGWLLGKHDMEYAERSNSADRRGGEKAMKTETTTPAPKVGSSALFSELVSKAAKMTRSQVQSAIDACHPCTLETDESYAADALAMELIHGRHDKREIVNMIRWVLMGCPSENVLTLPTEGAAQDS